MEYNSKHHKVVLCSIKSMGKKLAQTALLALALSATATAQDVPECGNLNNGYGPYNYVTQKKKLGVVEKYHFTRGVEQLIKGKSGSIDGDIDYTLRAFPNHHRALLSISKWERLQKIKKPHFIPRYFTTECYFKRAMAFSPRDSVVYILYGMYQHKKKNYDSAEKFYKISIKLNGNYSEAYYNLGLLYIEMKKIDLARINAQKAYKLGYPLQGLKNKLSQLNRPLEKHK